MKISVSRLESFSDALIAIIMTLMVLEIQLPQVTAGAELLEFLQSVLLYGASFIIVGSQWTRHHRMLDRIETVSGNFIWMNLLVLFLLSLVPLFMKWLIRYPASVLPALGYAVIYLLSDIGMRLLAIILIRENQELEIVRQIGRQRERLSFLRFLLLSLYITALLALSILMPELSIFCFIILPVFMSFGNLFLSDRQRIPQEKMISRPFRQPRANPSNPKPF